MPAIGLRPVPPRVRAIVGEFSCGFLLRAPTLGGIFAFAFYVCVEGIHRS